MQNPYGKECQYFYGDYYRGRNREECRLLPGTGSWKPDLCRYCPVPDILQANSCQHMQLRAETFRPLLVLKPQVRIHAFCSITENKVSEPHIGCGQCHKLPPIFMGESDEHNHSN
ncbi:MAG: hypothetical protein IMY76_05720 [Chloroflexi bacterium]|nr:hypothetical protein [Chloroflexota bacterium]